MRKIAVVTGSRADYGLLYWILKAVQHSDDLRLQLIVTGSHLVREFGHTVDCIINDGFVIEKKVNILLADDTPDSIAKSMGLALIGFSDVYEELKPDMLLLLGDRFEVFAAACAAIPFNIPIAHLHGGEITEGAIDEQIRHSITKLSHIHMASTVQYAENIVRMGELPDSVFCVGAPGLEWINKCDYITKEKLGSMLGLNIDDDIILATFHPVTLEQEKSEEYINNILNVLQEINLQVIFTGTNSDPSGRIINDKLKSASSKCSRIHFIENLGQRAYLSCQKYSTLMLGNSSSGIIESASFGLPVVNVGNRQRGRLQSGNVINVGYSKNEILNGIELAMSQEFKEKASKIKNIYGDGNTSSKVIDILRKIDLKSIKYKRLNY